MGRLRCPRCGHVFLGDPALVRCPNCAWAPPSLAPPAAPSPLSQPPAMAQGAPGSRGSRMALWAFVSSLSPLAVLLLGWLLEAVADPNGSSSSLGLLEGFGSLLLLGGPVAAIALGIAARRDPSTDQTGRNLALAAIIIGAITLGMYVVAILFVILLVMACISACGSATAFAGPATAGALPCATLTVSGSAGSGGRIGHAGTGVAGKVTWREALAHHPDLPVFRADVVRIAGLRVCVGCATLYPVVAAASVAAWLWPMPAAFLWAAGIALASVQAVSIAGLARRRWQKVAVKACLGAGGALLLRAVLDAPWPDEVKSIVLAAGGLAALASARPRLQRMARMAAASPA